MSPPEQVKHQSNSEYYDLSGHKLFPAPLDGRSVDMPVPSDNCPWTANNHVLDCVPNENCPVSEEQPHQGTPKQLRNPLEDVHFGFVVG
jgi:hypothetical protein